MFEDFDDNRSAFQKLKKYFSVRLVIQVLIFICGLVVSGFGLYQLYSDSMQISDENIGSTTQVCKKNPEFGRLTVDIGGAIENPGVYELDIGSRMNDLINIAGGFTNSVDKYYTNKILNLSQHLSDGEKFYIPTFEESIELQEKQLSSNFDSGDFKSLVGIVSINFASKSELTSLTGIGEKRAEDIIAERPYDSIYQVVEKGVITESIFEKIKNSVSL